MSYTTAQPGRTAIVTNPLGWVTFQEPTSVVVVRNYPDQQEALVQLPDGRLCIYNYDGRLEVTR